MKRKELLRLLARAGATFKEEGNHTKIYKDGKFVETLPRHTEVKPISNAKMCITSENHALRLSKIAERQVQ